MIMGVGLMAVLLKLGHLVTLPCAWGCALTVSLILVMTWEIIAEDACFALTKFYRLYRPSPLSLVYCKFFSTYRWHVDRCLRSEEIKWFQHDTTLGNLWLVWSLRFNSTKTWKESHFMYLTPSRFVFLIWETSVTAINRKAESRRVSMLLFSCLISLSPCTAHNLLGGNEIQSSLKRVPERTSLTRLAYGWAGQF